MTILEEINDLETYLNGLPDGLKEDTVFNSYKLRLVELNNKLLRENLVQMGMNARLHNQLLEAALEANEDLET